MSDWNFSKVYSLAPHPLSGNRFANMLDDTHPPSSPGV